MTEIISVRFKEGGKSYYFNPNGLAVRPGDKVIIETSRGVEFGECVEGNRLIDEMELVSPLRPVLRLATKEDVADLERNKAKEAHAFEVCQQKILEHGLDMKLVEVEYSFDGSKILFFFTAEGRVDFRALVRDLASIFHTRIELRQIGVRDEAKMLGGLGICGRPFCCASFLDDFHPVSIKMAKTQNLSLNPTKISGVCGRLMCCLKYEQEAYEDVVKRVPKQDSLVETPDGVGDVISVQMLREKVKVRLDCDPDNPQCYHCSEICVIRNGKGKRPEGYERPDPSEVHPPVRTTPLRNSTLEPDQSQERPARPQRQRPQEGGRTAEPAPAESGEAGAPRSSGEKKHRSRKRGGEKKPRPAGEGQPAGEKKPNPPKAKKPEGEQPQKQEGQGQGNKPRRKRPPRKRSNKPRPTGEGGGSAPEGES